MTISKPHKSITALEVRTLIGPCRRRADKNLYLEIDKPSSLNAKGSRHWEFIYKPRSGSPEQRKKNRYMGLGPAGEKEINLADARDLAAKWRQVLRDGFDPIEVRERERVERERALARRKTFGEFADDYIAAHEKGWRNEKHRQQWKNTLLTHGAALRDRPIDAVGTDDVLEVLKPIWTEKAETASRLRGRIEQILDAARVKGLRSGENPARWRGHLAKLLPKRAAEARGHHAAMAYSEVPSFMAILRDEEGRAARALEFAILTAARSGEVLGARWEEFDLTENVWTVPGSRMKSKREHRVPLSARAVEIVKAAADQRENDFVFPGRAPKKPLSNMAFEMMLRRLKIEATPHGFRSSFRDWAGDKTTFSREVAEAALAHAVGDATEAAYRRSDALEKRRRLMDAWGAYCASAGRSGNVVTLRTA